MEQAAECASAVGSNAYMKALSESETTSFMLDNEFMGTRRRLGHFDNWDPALQISFGCSFAIPAAVGISFDCKFHSREFCSCN